MCSSDRPSRNRTNRKGKKRNKGPYSQNLLTRQPATTCMLFGNLTVNHGATVLQCNQIASSIWLAARYQAFSASFLNVNIKKVIVEPIGLAVNQYIEYALLPSHLPALLSGFDATPSAPLATSAIMTMPGACRAQQGNNLPPRCIMKCPKTMQFSCARVNTDSPPIAFLVSYSTVNTLFNFWVEVSFTGYNTIA